jgi:hypothetical protein
MGKVGGGVPIRSQLRSADQEMDRGVSARGHQAAPGGTLRALGGPGGSLTLDPTNQVHALYQSKQGTCLLESITMVRRGLRRTRRDETDEEDGKGF